MSGRIEPVLVLMCDDIRHELDGGHSLMGVATPILEVSGFPVRRRLWFAVVMNTLAVGVTKFETRIRWKGEVKWSAEHEILIDLEERGTVFPISGPFAGYDEPGDLTFEFVADGKTTEVQKWSVIGPSELNKSEPALPPARPVTATKMKKPKK